MLAEIVREIEEDWDYGITPAALPHLEAMRKGESKSVRLFLANASAWRGEKARRTKKFLRRNYA